MRGLIGTLLTAGLCALAGPALAASTLTGMDFEQRSDGQLDVMLRFSDGVPEVRGYRIDSPPRLAIDLMDTVNELDQRRFELGLAGVDSLVALSAGDRTRLVLTLNQALPYATREQGNTLMLRLGEGIDDSMPSARRASADEPATPRASPGVSNSQVSRITDIDFRRGDDDASRLVVTLDREGVDTRFNERGGRIVATLDGVALPAEWNQVLDVSDFGTPMQRIVPQGGAQNTTLAITTRGEYTLLSTQSGRQLIIEAKPVSRAEQREQERERFPFTGKRITLNFQDIQVREVLSIIGEFTGLNVVASDSVQGSVTLNLQDVPWDQALDLVLKSRGLASRQSGNVLVVAPANELAAMERQELEAQAQQQELAPLTTQYIQVRYAKAEELASLLRGADGLGLLSERGRVSVDARTNTLLLQETPEQIEAIRRTLDQLDIPVRQVQIEARIVIARDSAAQELGVNWGLSSPAGSRFDLSGAADGNASTVPTTGNDPASYGGGLAVDLGNDVSPASAFSFGYLSGDILLDLELRALESEGKSQTISQPKVITANQQTAVIKQGQEIPYQEATSSGATNVEFKEAVLSLEVTPQITPDDRIIMDLIVKNDDVSDTSFAGAPAIDTNEIQTQVLVNNGETVVLGGILTTEQLRNLFKTPFLGDLPVLGQLFRYTEESNEKVELLVFITPKIIEDNLAIR
ncbi:type IV pilus secretin PilQ family protein [Modicisalibacter zincidurans]|uniref:type IV pilus secretin PilQ family protein n=1 Tax=Modicisalibacter zincidurans TaxID=1178777 RepID=UPI00068E5C63|nr:type IV pilus secretin PilQ family protein [Halomonas zincidurans]